MSDTIISVENLSKSYLVGHQSQRPENYAVLRDVIAKEAHNFARKMRDFVRGRQILQADQVEEFWALRDVTFDVRRGEVLGVVGRNGAGKSTLLKILSRITEPTRGRVTIRGHVVSLLEVGTGFHPELTGRENIYLNGAILGMTRQEIRRKFDEIVAFAETEQFLDTPVKHYSSGMYVRLAFAVAAHLEPEVLIVDEVLAVGDAEFQRKCLGKMNHVAKQEGRTVLFVSHNMPAVETLCDQAIYLDKGCIRGIGRSATIVAEYMQNTIETTRMLVNCGKTKHFRSFTMKDRDGTERDSFQIGEDIVFEIELHSDEFIDHPRCGIAICNQSAGRIATLHTDIQQKSHWAFRGPKRLRAIWKRVPLNVGNYQVDVGLWGYDRDLETLVGCRELMIQPSDVYQTGVLPDPSHQGHLIPEVKWEIIGGHN
jgi:lipopolysaccharide transport system ATP-binding protein